MRIHKIGATLAAIVALALGSFGQNLQTPALSTIEPQLTFEEANERAARPRWLSLKYSEFDTSGLLPAMDPDLVSRPIEADESGYFLVQLTGPITEDAKESVRSTGATLLDYIPNFTFIVRANTAQMELIKGLPAVVWTGDFHPAYRLDVRLHEESLNPRKADTIQKLIVMAFEGVSKDTIETQITSRGASIGNIEDGQGRWIAEVYTSAAIGRWLAQAPDVQWVEPMGEMTTRNNTAKWVIQTFTTNNTKIWDQGIHGEGQVVGHIDGGALATSNCYLQDPSGNPIGPTHRKIVYHAGGSIDSHSQHTAGTAVGDAQPVNGSTSNRGMAYLAKIASSGGFASGSQFNTKATTHKNNGATVHTNSWGNDGTTAYDSTCNSIDSFSWNNENNLVLFASTNLSTLKNPENAKNLIAVNASQNGANANNFCSGGAGLTADGRRKPEAYAPGCSIVSAGTGSCTTTTLTGTSMACPGVTGATALVRQYFIDGFYPTGAKVPANTIIPTGALVKAALLNSCQDMTGIAGYPSNTEGWGRVELDQALSFTGDARKIIVKDVRKSVGVTTGQTKNYVFNVTSNTQRLAITLAFHDFPGTTNSSNPVINNLNLTLTAPGSVIYLGNVFSGGFSTTGGTADTKNNVERILINVPAVGQYTATVTAANVAQGPQGFGLVINGAVQEGVPGPAISNISPTATAVAVAGATPVLTINGSNFTGATNVAIGTRNYPIGKFTIVSDTQITVKFTPPPAPLGNVNVNVTGPGGTSNSNTLTLSAPAGRFVFFDPSPANDGAPITVYMASPSIGFLPLLAYSQCIQATPIPPYATYSIGGCGDFNFAPDPIAAFDATGITSWTTLIPVGATGIFFLQFSEANPNTFATPFTLSGIAVLTVN
ncbi:MAG: S8 family serine peptidase [Planctomycetota bacterium]